MKNTIISIVVLVVIVGGIFIYKNLKTSDNSNPKEISTGNTTNMPVPPLPSSGNIQPAPPTEQLVIKMFTVSGKNFAFEPSTISVNKGDTVMIIFKNTGGTHDFRIDEFNIATKQIKGGTEEIVQFVVDKAGSFEYYCSVGTHRAMGMKGTLLVIE